MDKALPADDVDLRKRLRIDGWVHLEGTPSKTRRRDGGEILTGAGGGAIEAGLGHFDLQKDVRMRRRGKGRDIQRELESWSRRVGSRG